MSGILFVVELVEGKEHPRQAGPLEFEDLGGKTVGLLLRMIKSYFDTGRYVIIDSGFCVLKGLIQLRKKGVFSCYFIKKRIYWPETVPGKEMEDHFLEVEVGETDSIQSMSIWNSRWTCPGWTFFTIKTHPFGNDQHTDCCELSGILFVVELVEGKEHPRQAGPLEFEELDGNTVGLLLRMMK